MNSLIDLFYVYSAALLLLIYSFCTVLRCSYLCILNLQCYAALCLVLRIYLSHLFDVFSYAAASPASLLPLNVPHVTFHGTADTVVSYSMNQQFIANVILFLCLTHDLFFSLLFIYFISLLFIFAFFIIFIFLLII